MGTPSSTKELARDQDLRAIPPAGIRMAPLDRPADVQQPARRYIRRTHDARSPMPGTAAYDLRRSRAGRKDPPSDGGLIVKKCAVFCVTRF